MDILLGAYNKKILTETECDCFISTVLSKGSKLPFTNFRDYLKSLKK